MFLPFTFTEIARFPSVYCGSARCSLIHLYAFTDYACINWGLLKKVKELNLSNFDAQVVCSLRDTLQGVVQPF